MSGENWKDPEGTFRSDWTGAWLVGAIFLVILFFVLAFAFGIL